MAALEYQVIPLPNGEIRLTVSKQGRPVCDLSFDPQGARQVGAALIKVADQRPQRR